jgi:type IV secretion system protein TrbL
VRFVRIESEERMNDLSVIDRFTNLFSLYIDSGFGLLSGETAFLTATLVVIDMTLAGLFWAMGGQEDVIAKLIKKTLYVGTFAYILSNFRSLSGIVFRSFAGLGLTASGAPIPVEDLLRPGRLASVGVDAGRPILETLSSFTGFPDVFSNLDQIVVLVVAWLIVLLSFFILAVQLFVTLIEFKLTTLAGFVLIPFALWNKTAFLAERVLGNVISSGIKVLVLAIIVGIGTGIFGQLAAPPGGDPSIDQVLAIMLASLAMFGLGIFGPGIATGLVSGGPQLGAGAAAGTLLAGGGALTAASAAATGGARLLAGSSVRAATMPTGGAPPSAGPSSSPSGASSGAHTAGSPASSTGSATAEVPAWARRLQQGNRVSQGVSMAAHTLRSSDHGSHGANPSLTSENT